jgi:YjbE family integral membrane protein
LDYGILGAILAIIAIDLVLSGDNAVVIGMAARRLPAHQRRQAIIWGGAGAIILRIIFTMMAFLLLDMRFIQAIGGLLLIWIAIKLLRPLHEAHAGVREADTMAGAIRTIIMADAVMSLDNMLAVAGTAKAGAERSGAEQHSMWLLLFGLALSIPILLLGSSIVSHYISKYPWLNYVGAAILVYTAVEMFFADKFIHEYIDLAAVVEYAIIAVIVGFVMLIGIWMNRRAHSPHLDPAAPGPGQRRLVSKLTRRAEG